MITMEMPATACEQPRSYLSRSANSTQIPLTLATMLRSAMQVLSLPATHMLAQQESRNQLYARVHYFTRLPQDWDGYDGIPATYESWISAVEFIQLLPNRVDTPFAMLSGDGEISLFWENAKNYLEVSFPGDGTYHYIFTSQDRDIQFASDDLSLNERSINKNFIKHLEMV